MQTGDFLHRWGVRHRMSSAYFPSSNSRAELAVKSTKRLLMENVGPDGNLNTGKVVRSLLTQRNTPDPASKLSPAKVLFARPLRDTLPFIDKSFVTFDNPQVNGQWRDLWKTKEETMRKKYDQTLAYLAEHSRPLPPLQLGDLVFIQNQTGSQPRKWDRTGTIVETKPHDQYQIKVSGTGRVTLRNRRFLRKIKEFPSPSDAVKPNDRTSQLTKSSLSNYTACDLYNAPPQHVPREVLNETPKETEMFEDEPAHNPDDPTSSFVEEPSMRVTAMTRRVSSSTALNPSADLLASENNVCFMIRPMGTYRTEPMNFRVQFTYIY